MSATLLLFVFMCWTASTHADHHQSCRSSNMTGVFSVVGLQNEIKALAPYTYDSTNKKLRFRTDASNPWNATMELDLLVLFEEGILYKIDSKNQSCVKKSLQSRLNPLAIPANAVFHGAMVFGSASIEGEGIKLNIWAIPTPDLKGNSYMSVSMGCIPFSLMHLTDNSMIIFSNINVELEVKDPDLLAVPSFCQGLPVEETPEGTVYGFMTEFL
ncbi:ependymin [Nerophis lumbriciformis]|uniref:ependymin n=1 Tax=Nerophis lumbriciformis TaxID=546530 RepID=UPI002ADFE347|nr:ependymin-1-like [Nerophis lumbriciformis]